MYFLSPLTKEDCKELIAFFGIQLGFAIWAQLLIIYVLSLNFPTSCQTKNGDAHSQFIKLNFAKESVIVVHLMLGGVLKSIFSSSLYDEMNLFYNQCGLSEK